MRRELGRTVLCEATSPRGGCDTYRDEPAPPRWPNGPGRRVDRLTVRWGAAAIIRRDEPMSDIDDGRAPTAERLLDVRTPAELAVSPDGIKVAFALHATVADDGSFAPSDLYVIGRRPRRDGLRSPAVHGATGRRFGRRTARAWRSCRIGSRPGTSSRTRWSPGGEPSLRRRSSGLRERGVVERRHAGCWSWPPIPAPTAWTGAHAP